MSKSSENNLTSLHWRVLIVLAFVQFLHIVDFMILMPLGPQLMRQFAIETDQFGYLVAAYSFSAATAGVLASSLVNRFDRKKSLICLLIGFLLSTISCAFADSYLALVAARVVAGACGGLLGSQSFAILGDFIPDPKRGFATGVLMSAFSMASVLGVPIGLALATRSSWHAPFLALGIAGVPLVVCVLFFVPPLRSHLADSSQGFPMMKNSTWQDLKITFGAKGHVSGFLLTFCVLISGFLMIPYLSPFFVRNRNLAESDLPLIYFCGGLATFVSGPLIGKMVDGFGAQRLLKKLVVLALIPILGISALDVWYPGPLPLYLLLCLTTTFFILVSGRMVPLMTLLNKQVEPRLRGGFLSVNSSMQMIAAGLGATLGGLLIGKTADVQAPMPSYERVGFASVMFVLAALFFLKQFAASSDSSKSISEN
jgi:MFS transporter, DHA1 family, inner membrane transport protein